MVKPDDKVIDLAGICRHLILYQMTLFFRLANLKAFADNKVILTKTLKIVLEWLENVEKGENAGYQHFLLFPNAFRRLLFQGR